MNNKKSRVTGCVFGVSLLAAAMGLPGCPPQFVTLPPEGESSIQAPARMTGRIENGELLDKKVLFSGEEYSFRESDLHEYSESLLGEFLENYVNGRVKTSKGLVGKISGTFIGENKTMEFIGMEFKFGSDAEARKALEKLVNDKSAQIIYHEDGKARTVNAVPAFPSGGIYESVLTTRESVQEVTGWDIHLVNFVNNITKTEAYGTPFPAQSTLADARITAYQWKNELFFIAASGKGYGALDNFYKSLIGNLYSSTRPDSK